MQRGETTDAGDRRAPRARARRALAVLAAAGWLGACSPASAPSRPFVERPMQPAVWAEPEVAAEPAPAMREAVAEPPPAPSVDPAPEAGPDEVVVFRDGEPADVLSRSDAEASGLFVLDVGTDWVPLLFRSTSELPHDYEQAFVDLANGRFDDSPEGWRAAQERYLEPHGIPPTPALLARRMAALAAKPCASRLDLAPLQEVEGASWEDGAAPPPLPAEAIDVLQVRLVCEEHLRSRPTGVLDEATRSALEEFERRNRIYARASLKGETLEALRVEPLELERRALVRVLLERLILDLGVIEDGSAIGAFPARKGGLVEDAPAVVRRIEQRIVEAFGVRSVHGAQRFYERLHEVLTRPHYALAIDPVDLPDYHTEDMDLWVEIDRGDFFYEFPFDEHGNPLGYRIERGPTITLFARDGDRVVPLVLYPTTIGGWRLRRHSGEVYWDYKQSPAGLRAWRRIVAAPVWLPPRSTLSETLVIKLRRTSDGSEFTEVNKNLIGPSFASAYGLVAAHHQRAVRRGEGELEIGKDDGMRTHGSSDYTSIWRTVSSGCHRLHNHLAVRLFNFILQHRAHRRVGHLPTHYRLDVTTAEFQDRIQVTRTGYEFSLDRPIEVRILPGRVRGELKHPLRRRIPAAADESSRKTILFTPTRPGQ